MRFLSRTAKYGNILEEHAHRFGKTCDAYIYLLLHQSDSDQMTDARHKDNRPLRSVNFNVARPMSFTWEWINEQAPPTENHCDVCVVCQRNFRLQKGAKGNMSNTWHVEMFYSRRAIFKLKKNFREFFVGNKKGQLWSLKSRKKCLTRASYADGRQRWPVDILRGRPSGAVNISDDRRTNNNNRKKKKSIKITTWQRRISLTLRRPHQK